MRTSSTVTLKQLLSASGLALATALVAAGPSLRAQSFNATGTVVGGNATIFASATTTAITVSSPSAVINWVPTDTAATGGPINFQSSGTTATFQNDFNNQNFAVLNRIIPSGSTRPVQFNGTVISQLQQFSLPPTRGGTVFFYSPGGIVIGGGSTFDVGKLVLTTSDLSFDGEGNFDTNGSYVFRPATVAGSQIVVNAGASMTASLDGSYIALVAPSLVNNGTINVNGAAALVAADAATITFSPSGLFDIEVTSGTSATGAVLTNNGEVGGPAATSPDFFHRVYMVAVPKNDAITMAIGAGSTLGFDIAGAADAVGNTIVLSAGHDVVGGQAFGSSSLGGGSGTASITGGDSNFTSAAEARTSGTINLEATQPDGLTFAGQALFRAGVGDSSITASGADSFVRFDNILQFSASRSGNSANLDGQGGGIALRALDGGQITIVSSAGLNATGIGARSSVVGTNSGNGTGGSILVEALNGGRVNFQLDLEVFANGLGGVPETGGTGIGGGNGTAGSVTFRSAGTPGSDIAIAGLTVYAQGFGGSGNGCTTCLFDGGAGTGGAITLASSGAGNSIGVTGNTELSALSAGGQSTFGVGGNATGGTIAVNARDGGNVTLRNFEGTTGARGGSSQIADAGSATGGAIDFLASGTGAGGIAVTGNLFLESNAEGGLGAASGGTAQGGTITVSARDEKAIGITGNLFANSEGIGGAGFVASSAGNGGSVTFEATTAGFLDVAGFAGLSAKGTGAFADGTQTAGIGNGGVATLRSAGGRMRFGNTLSISAEGRGGEQFSNGTGGIGTGGLARIVIDTSGRIDLLSNVEILAQGIGGAAGSGPDSIGGNGVGGNARLDLGGGTLGITGNLTLASAGRGRFGEALGGSGLGGTTSITQNNNALTVGGDSYIGAVGEGASGSSEAAGNIGGGGSIEVLANQSTANFSTLGTATFEATGFGAGGQSSGAGVGGIIQITAAASTITAGTALQFFSEGQGGAGGFTGGDGALGTGGQISLTASGSAVGASRIAAPVLNISTTGRGGTGTSAFSGTGSQPGDGGTGSGGIIALVSAPDGGTIETPQLIVNAAGIGGQAANGATVSGPGGDAGSGGSATGGQINFGSVRGTGTATGGFILGEAVIDAGATGANGGTGGAGFPAGNGGSGGNATGGAINMLFDAGGSRLAVAGPLQVLANATGGNTGQCFTACVAAAGTGTGGTINLGSDGLTTGNTMALQSLEVSAFGAGGSGSGASGAQATGGSVLVKLGAGMTLTADSVSLDAFATGGNAASDSVANLSGGAALGGSAQFTASGTGSATITEDFAIIANGTAGSGLAPDGTGGNGTGGTAILASDGGSITLGASADLQANGIGGAGDLDGIGSGGTGLGGTAQLTVGTQAELGNGGRIAVLSLVNASADAGGGAGFTAGGATGGVVAITARQGRLELNDVLATADAFGGKGVSGGAGGNAAGGTITIVALNAVEGTSLLQATGLTALANARGGDGAEIADPNAVGAAGGSGRGGNISVLASAGNGGISIDQVLASADATGGVGGTAVFDFGGVGGLATGGTVQLGLTSGIDTGTVNTGSARFGSVEATATGRGGDGGTAEFAGGNGGNAIGGGITLIAQGGPVTVETASSFDANATGGSGGFSQANGNGGNATIGNLSASAPVSGVNVRVTERLNQSTQRGNLTAASLAMTASAIGGSGTVTGSSTMANSAIGLTVNNGSLAATSLAMTASADTVNPAAQPDMFSMANGTATFTSNLTISTPNAFSLTLNNANATADQVLISASNWLLAGPAPATLGTLTGTGELQLSSGQDLVAYANLRSDGLINLAAIGRISFGAVGALGRIVADAGTSLTLGDVSSQEDITITAGTNIVAGILAGLGPVSIEAGGNVMTGSIFAGTGAPSASGVSPIAISAGGNISTGTIASTADVALYSQGTIGTGRISAFDALLLGHGAISLGGFDNANRVLIADRAMAFPSSGPAPTKEQILSANPIATAGSVSIAGPSVLASLRIAAGTTAALAGLNATGDVEISSGGNAILADVVSGGLVTLSSSGGSVQAGTVSGAGGVFVSAGGALSLSTVNGGSVSLNSGNALVAGNISAGSGGATVAATGNATLGNVVSAGSVNLSSTGGALKTGNIAGSSIVAASGATGLDIGTVNGDTVSLASGVALVAGEVTAGTGGALVLASGSVTLGNVSSAGLASLSSTGGALSTANINAGSSVAVSGATGLELGSVDGGSVALTSGAALFAGNVTAGSGGVTAVAAGNATLGNVITTGLVNLSSTNGVFRTASINTGSSVSASGATGLELGSVDGGSVALTSGAALFAGNVTARSGDAVAVAAANATFGDIRSAGQVDLSSGGTLNTGSITGLSSITASGNTGLESGAVNGATISLSSGATLVAGNITAGSGGATVVAAGNTTLGNVTGAELVNLVSAGGTLKTGVINSASSIAVNGAGGLDIGAVDGVAVSLKSGSALLSGNVTAGSGGASAQAVANATLGNVSSAGLIDLSSTSGSLKTGSITGATSVVVNGATGLDIGAVNGAGVSLSSGAALLGSNITAGAGGMTALVAGNATIGDLISAGFVSISSTGGSLKAGSVTGSSTVVANGATALELGAVTGSSVSLRSNAAVIAGNAGAAAGGLRVIAGTDVLAGNLSSAQDVFVVSGGNVTAGVVRGADALVLASAGVQLGALAITGRGLIANASMASITSQPNPAVPVGSLNKEAIFAAMPVATGGAVTLTAPSSAGSLRIASGAAVSTSDILASGNIGITSSGNGTFGALRSSGGNIELLSHVGNLSALGIDAGIDVLVRAAEGLNLQTIAGRDVALLSGAGVQIGSVRAGVALNPATGAITGATGRLLVGNASMLPTTATPGSFGYAALFSAVPVAAGGPVDIRRAIAGRITSASTSAFSGSSLTGFERIDVTSGGRITVAERWTSPSVTISGADIAIINNGSSPSATGQPLLSGIRTTPDGSVDIFSTSSSPARIGDGLSGQGGFALSNDEIGLISTSRLTISANDVSLSAIDMVIGNVRLTAGGDIGASTLAGSSGRITFATGNGTSAAGGTIRVTGALDGTGFGSGNILEFSTGTFELDAATGSIKLASTGTTLGGIARFNAGRIHLASADILDKLTADPLYTGRVADLNGPAAVQRPEGVLRALGLDFHPTGTLFIQNTGTVLNPAGFFSDIAFTGVAAPAGAQPGSLSVIMNGAFQTDSGIISGVDAHGLAVSKITERGAFSEDSQINGCLFSAARCAILPGDGEDPDVIGAISGQIVFNANDPLGSTPGFGEPDDEDDETNVQLPTGDSVAAGPIAPPTSIINDAPLDVTSPIEEPVTGGGNSALYGAGTSGNGNVGGDDQ